jgi:hypothetical protein
MKNLSAKNKKEKMTSPLRSDPSGHTTADICKGFATFSFAIATENVRYLRPLSLSLKRQPTHIQAHLVLPDTKSRPFAKPKELEISEAIHEHQ